MRRHFLLTVLILTLSGCTAITLPGQATPSPVPTVTESPIPEQTGEPTPTPTGPVTIKLWLPPEFDPSKDKPAAAILRKRLEDFSTRRPNIEIEVRIKSLDGPGSLLDSLTTASAAAPLAIPDLIALPYPDLETAAIKGLLHPLDELSAVMDETDWYEYARQLSRLQNSTFGLPFAGDALTLVYRPTTVQPPPESFSSTLQTAATFAFPAADPQSLFTLALYQATGSPTLDEQDHPVIDPAALAIVLGFYHDAATSEIMPFWLTQYMEQNEVWEAYQENRADMVVTWVSDYLQTMPADSMIASIPTYQGTDFTLATGWVWALSSATPQRQSLSVELAEFLSESEFLAEWTAAAGYLPPRSSALASWNSASLRPLVQRIVHSARILPPADILNSLSPLLEKATVEVLKLQSDPVSAAQSAAASLINP